MIDTFPFPIFLSPVRRSRSNLLSAKAPDLFYFFNCIINNTEQAVNKTSFKYYIHYLYHYLFKEFFIGVKTSQIHYPYLYIIFAKYLDPDSTRITTHRMLTFIEKLLFSIASMRKVMRPSLEVL